MKAYNRIVSAFGREILDDELEIDRKRLGELIFNDQAKRRQLNSIMHPIIRHEVLKQVFLNFLFNQKLIFIDVPLLYESKSLLRFVQKVIVISCDREQQIERIMKRNQFSREEAESRVASQMDLKLKCELANYVIDNSKDLDNLKASLDETLANIKKLNLHSRNLLIFRVLLLLSTVACGFSFLKLLKLISIGGLKLLGLIPFWELFKMVTV